MSQTESEHLQDLASVLNSILKELKILVFHLSLWTGLSIEGKDVD